MPIDRPARAPRSPAEEQARYERAVQRDAARLRQKAREKGIPIDALSGNGWSALHHAVNDGKLDRVHVLLAAGADPNLPVAAPAWPWPASSSTGDRPAHLALSANRADIMRALIDHGADLSLTNALGEDLAAFAATCDPILHPLAQQAQVWAEARALRATLASETAAPAPLKSPGPRRL